MSPTPPPPPPPPPSVSAGAQLGKRRSSGLVILLTIVTCGVWTCIWAYQNGDELQRWRGDGLGGLGHLLITLFIAPVTMFLLASEVEEAYRELGRRSPVTTLLGLWFLLPLIGNLIWYIQIQSAINEYWTALGQNNDPGL